MIYGTPVALRQSEALVRVERIGLQGNLPDPGLIGSQGAKHVASLTKRQGSKPRD